MTRSISALLLAHLTDVNLTLAGLICIHRTDGVTVCLTNHDEDITFQENTYLSDPGIEFTNIQSTGGLDVDNLALRGALDDSAISREDAVAGRYEGAEFVAYTVNYNDPENQYLIDKTGVLGKVTIRDWQFEFEVLGLIEHLQYEQGELTSAQCRARFGDVRCKASTQYYRTAGLVTEVSSNARFVANLQDVDPTNPHQTNWQISGGHWFTFGTLFWDVNCTQFTQEQKSGNNDNHGIVTAVLKYDYVFVEGIYKPTFTLIKGMPYPIDVGDAFYVVAGCDKKKATCAGKFSNVINFQGEPDLPGEDRVMGQSS